MSPSAHLILALVEILYFGPSILPLVYLLHTHRHSPLPTTWLFLLLFTLLQLTGSGMILSAGPYGVPSAVAIILIQVGLSPLILGLSSGAHAYAKMAGVIPKGKRKLVVAGNVLFHVAVVAAIAIYAVGASGSFKRPRPEDTAALCEAGVLLLLALFIVLCSTFGCVAAKTWRIRIAGPLFWSITVSLLLLAVRIIYSTIAAFRLGHPQFNPVTGRMVYEIVLVFLPGALIVAAMVTGGVVTSDREVSANIAAPKEDPQQGPKMPAD